MTLSLSPQIQKLIDDRVRSGQYKTPEDVIAAAISTLDQQEQLGEFAPGELESLIAAGESNGPPLDGEQVLSELKQLRNRPQSKAG